jgi:hypothetical protein
VVKDPTYPGPSLVTEVQYSSPTILQQLQVIQPVEKEVMRSFGVFQQEGTLVEEDPLDLERGGGFGSQNLLGFHCVA